MQGLWSWHLIFRPHVRRRQENRCAGRVPGIVVYCQVQCVWVKRKFAIQLAKTENNFEKNLMINSNKKLLPETIPSFSWDRNLTCQQIRDLINNGTKYQSESTLAWVLREAAMNEVWSFCTPKQVYEKLNELENHLGRRKDFFRYILRTWHELGKF